MVIFKVLPSLQYIDGLRRQIVTSHFPEIKQQGNPAAISMMQVRSVVLFAIPRASWILTVTVLCNNTCPRYRYSREFDEGQLTQWNKLLGLACFDTPKFLSTLCVYRIGFWSYVRQLPATVTCNIKTVQRQGWPPRAGGKDDVSREKGWRIYCVSISGTAWCRLFLASLCLNFAGLKLEVRSGLTDWEFDSVINVYCSKAPASLNNDWA